MLIKQNFSKKVLKKNKFFRSSSIPSCFISLRLGLYKGNYFKKIFITKQMVSFKFGEFSFSRKPFFYPKKDIKKKR
jgi:ribosomal protein S19